ncbi:MAG: hypothetical protein RLZZ192_490 [Pseudomonadota bacterium]
MSRRLVLRSAPTAAQSIGWHPALPFTPTRLPTLPIIFATPEEAELAFYDALERADLPRLMQVWAEDEEIICVHPGGLRIVGLHAVKESWQEILANGGLRIRPSLTVALHSMMGAVHSLIEQITVKSADSTEIAHCYATNVYHKGPTGWKLVMHHASAAPVEAGILDLHDKPGLLH